MPDIQVRLRQVGPTTSEASLPRGRAILVDRPEAKGGEDKGPMGGEYFLAAVGGCFMSTLLAAIRAREAPITNVRTEVVGALAPDPPRFASLTLLVSADYDDEELFQHLVRVAEKGCIMVNSLERGVELTVRTEASVRE